jgi:hypothetical protein
MTKKDQGTLGRMTAPIPTARSGASPAITTTALSNDTVTIGVGRAISLRLRRYALVLQEQEIVRVTQREVAERILSDYLDGRRPAITLPDVEPELTRPINTLALDRNLLFRLKRHALDLAERLGRTVTMREVAEAMFNSVLDEANIRTSQASS